LSSFEFVIVPALMTVDNVGPGDSRRPRKNVPREYYYYYCNGTLVSYRIVLYIYTHAVVGKIMKFTGRAVRANGRNGTNTVHTKDDRAHGDSWYIGRLYDIRGRKEKEKERAPNLIRFWFQRVCVCRPVNRPTKSSRRRLQDGPRAVHKSFSAGAGNVLKQKSGATSRTQFIYVHATRYMNVTD